MGATRIDYRAEGVDGVSIRAPVMGATLGEADNPPTWYVSIRAPVMGATTLRYTLCASLIVSIRAPVMGATETSLARHRGSAGFNPRARDGRDLHHWQGDGAGQRFQSARP